MAQQIYPTTGHTTIAAAARANGPGPLTGTNATPAQIAAANSPTGGLVPTTSQLSAMTPKQLAALTPAQKAAYIAAVKGSLIGGGLGAGISGLGSWIGGQVGSVVDPITSIPGNIGTFISGLNPGSTLGNGGSPPAGGSFETPSGVPLNPAPTIPGLGKLIGGIGNALTTNSGSTPNLSPPVKNAPAGWGTVNTGLVPGKAVPVQTPTTGQNQQLLNGIIASLSKGGPDGSYQQIGPTYVPVDQFDFAGNQKNIDRLQGAATKLSGEDLLSWLPTAIKMAAAQYGPSIAQTQAAGQGALNTIATYNRGGEQLLNQVPGQINQDYRQVMGADRGIDQGIFNSLQAQNQGTSVRGLGVDPGQAASLQAGANKLGLAASVLQGMGSLGIGNLNAERANQVASARQLAGGVQIAGGQALAASSNATTAAIDKLAEQEAASATKTAGTLAGESSRRASQLLAESGQLSTTGNEAANRIAGENKANASAKEGADKANQSAAAAAARLQIAASNSVTSRAKLLYGIATKNGAATPAQAAENAKTYNTWFDAHAGTSGSPRSHNVPTLDPRTGLQAVNAQGVPQFHSAPYFPQKTTWANLVTGAQTDLGLSQVDAEALGGQRVNYGYGWDPANMDSYDAVSRPLDTQWQQALAKAHLPTKIFLSSPSGQPFITLAMARVIAKQPGGTFLTNTLRHSGNSKYGQIGYIPKTPG